MKIKSKKDFLNGTCYALENDKGKPIEVVDTFLPIFETATIKRHTNHLENDYDIGDRSKRWMIGISTMSGCPIKCPFCAVTGITEKFGISLLSCQEMLDQVKFVLEMNKNINPLETTQLKIQTTRMGEPSLNHNVLDFIVKCHDLLPNAKIFVSTVGIKNNFLKDLLKLKNSYKDDFIQLQFSIHTTNESKRRELQPNGKLMSFNQINEFGKKWMRDGDRKITLNYAITAKYDINNHDFEPKKIRDTFDKDCFFIKLSPLNDNDISERNNLVGVIPQHNYI